MDRLRFTIGFLLITLIGSAGGCGGASEAGPRLKRTQPFHEFRPAPEAASNTPSHSQSSVR